MKSKFIKYPLILGIVGLICAGALSVVYEITNPIIVERTKGATLSALREVIELDDVNEVTLDFDEVKLAESKIKTVYEAIKSKKTFAYGYQVSGTGYGGEMNFLVVMASDSETILGLKVVSHNETNSGKYGGPLLNSPDFAAQFKDLPFDKVDSDVDMVAGSTAKITLTGVKNCVNKVVDFHRVEILKQEVDLDKVELTNAELTALNLPAGQRLINKTEEFTSKFTDEKKLQKAVSDMGLLNFAHIVDANDAVVGYAYIFQSAQPLNIPEVGTQEFKMVYTFDKDWANSKITVVSSTDTLADAENSNYLNGPDVDKDAEGKAIGLIGNKWLEVFNGKTMAELAASLTHEMPLDADKVIGASFTTNEAKNRIIAVVKYHSQVNG